MAHVISRIIGIKKLPFGKFVVALKCRHFIWYDRTVDPIEEYYAMWDKDKGLICDECTQRLHND